MKVEQIETFIEYLQGYLINENPEQYKKETVLKDIIYFMGLSVDKKRYQYAQGYDLFVKHLFSNLNDAEFYICDCGGEFLKNGCDYALHSWRCELCEKVNSRKVIE